MKKLTFTIACLAVLASLAHSEVNWKRDLSSALKQAKASKQLIFVDFYADWCGPCKIASPILEEIGAEYAGKK